MKELYEYVINFMIENDVTCEETIHQTDRLQEKLTDFACDCFNLVKKDMDIKDED